jgi:hypothetical protein
MCGGPTESAYQKTANNQLGGVAENLQGILPNLESNAAGTSLPGIESGFQNFALTGGLSPGDVSGLEDQASQSARGVYSTASADAQRKMAATGGYGDVGSITGSLARQGSNAAGMAASNAGAGVIGMRDQNQLGGLAGQSNLYNINNNQMQSIINQILTGWGATANIANNPSNPGIFADTLNAVGTVAGGITGGLTAANSGGN